MALGAPSTGATAGCRGAGIDGASMKAPLWSMLGLAVLSGAGLATLGAAAMEGCPGVDGEGAGVLVLGEGRSEDAAAR